jgi:hypothetical protein
MYKKLKQFGSDQESKQTSSTFLEKVYFPEERATLQQVPRTATHMEQAIGAPDLQHTERTPRRIALSLFKVKLRRVKEECELFHKQKACADSPQAPTKPSMFDVFLRSTVQWPRDQFDQYTRDRPTDFCLQTNNDINFISWWDKITVH